MTETLESDLKHRLLDAILPEVAFDGWSAASFAAAASATGVSVAEARAVCPRGAVDLAVAFHRRGDARLRARLAGTDLSALRFRDRIAAAVRFRLEEMAADKEAVRRASALFALPIHAVEGAKLIWGTADTIWSALGDDRRDFAWATKRASLSAVYGATVLYWLGDTTPLNEATWAFLDRRIDEVMRVERLKGRMRENRLLARLMEVPDACLARFRPPGSVARDDLPGHVSPSERGS